MSASNLSTCFPTFNEQNIHFLPKLWDPSQYSALLYASPLAFYLPDALVSRPKLGQLQL